ATGLVNQRLYYPEATETERAAFVRTQDDVDGALGRRARGVFSGPELPEPAPGRPGDLFVLDGCAGLYALGLHREWLPVERTERSGLPRLRVRFPAAGRPDRHADGVLARRGERVRHAKPDELAGPLRRRYVDRHVQHAHVRAAAVSPVQPPRDVGRRDDVAPGVAQPVDQPDLELGG